MRQKVDYYSSRDWLFHHLRGRHHVFCPQGDGNWPLQGTTQVTCDCSGRQTPFPRIDDLSKRAWGAPFSNPGKFFDRARGHTAIKRAQRPPSPTHGDYLGHGVGQGQVRPKGPTLRPWSTLPYYSGGPTALSGYGGLLPGFCPKFRGGGVPLPPGLTSGL
ncbi:hypothetical protein GWK47_010251 [Chionoecetes opilio]|uniref:Uncharacterized protein n=1 Tax=Chionoecetes opilio TaxID=41210 RepID=A0A8J5CN77_CHIOP|nr:hypothetical protein GWK47_010251 [Chionoecetes opilio]